MSVWFHQSALFLGAWLRRIAYCHSRKKISYWSSSVKHAFSWGPGSSAPWNISSTFGWNAIHVSWKPDKSESSCFICSGRWVWPPSRSNWFPANQAHVGPLTTVKARSHVQNKHGRIFSSRAKGRIFASRRVKLWWTLTCEYRLGYSPVLLMCDCVFNLTWGGF